ncbi:hypothetical protein QUF56_13405 [Ureibacillus composti]|nr:hypothetical protein [Ureibacillus composti]
MDQYNKQPQKQNNREEYAEDLNFNRNVNQNNNNREEFAEDLNFNKNQIEHNREGR